MIITSNDKLIGLKMNIPILEEDAQTIFNFVANHLFTQNKPSLDTDETCVYRNPDGLSCAAGCLIPDDQYNENIEGRAWVDLVKFGIVSSKHSDLIKSLQMLHDDWGLIPRFSTMDSLKERLSGVAELYNLEWTF